MVARRRMTRNRNGRVWENLLRHFETVKEKGELLPSIRAVRIQIAAIQISSGMGWMSPKTESPQPATLHAIASRMACAEKRSATGVRALMDSTFDTF